MIRDKAHGLDASAVRLTSSATGVVIPVRLIPRARQTAIGGVREGALLVRIAAPPVDDAANDALLVFLAAVLGRPKRDLSIISGDRSRDKKVAVAGITREAVASILSDILPS